MHGCHASAINIHKRSRAANSLPRHTRGNQPESTPNLCSFKSRALYFLLEFPKAWHIKGMMNHDMVQREIN